MIDVIKHVIDIRPGDIVACKHPVALWDDVRLNPIPGRQVTVFGTEVPARALLTGLIEGALMFVEKHALVLAVIAVPSLYSDYTSHPTLVLVNTSKPRIKWVWGSALRVVGRH